MANNNITIAGGIITPEQLETIVQEVVSRITTTSKDPGQYDEVNSLTGISSIPTFQQSGNTYKLVRVAVSLLKGMDGKQIELQVASGYIQWRYENGVWTNLYSLADLKGEAGDTPEFSNSDTAILWKYTNEGGDAWRTLVEYKSLFNIDSLTPSQLDKLKLKFSDLTATDIQELQRPATEAAEDATRTVAELTGNVETAIGNASAATTAAEEAAQKAIDAATNVQDGKTPVFQTGTTITVPAGSSASLSIEKDGVDDSGNPIYKTNAEIPQGATGKPGADFTILGYYDSFDALTTAVTNPIVGNAYGVGLTAPYSIYVWDGVNNIWVDNGPLQGPEGIPGKSARVNTEKNVWQVYNDETGEWEDTDYIVQYSLATATVAGLMSSSDFQKLSGIQADAEVNVQSDWNESNATSDAFIQNKPALKSVATSGSYNDLTDKPTEIDSAKIANSIGTGGFLADGNNPVPINGLLWSNDSTVGFPGEYKPGNVLQISNLNTPDVNGEWSWINQILFGTNSRIYHRNFSNTAGWGTWARLAYGYEIPVLENRTTNITFDNKANDGTKIGIGGIMGGNDCWGIYSYSAAVNVGALEIATGDDGTEPIYVRQYQGNPVSTPVSQAVRTAALLDENGNTSFPGTVSSGGKVLVKTDDIRLINSRPVYSTNIGENEDLNTLSTPGFYHCIYNSIVATLKNSPTPNAFALVVERTTANSCVQFLTTYLPNSAELFYRNSLWSSTTNTTTYGNWQKIYTTYDKPPLATASENGLMGAADKVFVDYFQGYNAVTSLENLPLTKRLILCNLSTVSGNFTFNGTPQSGREYHIIISNSTSSAITQSINIGANSVYFGGNRITIPAGGYAEVNVLCVDGNMFYVRSGGQ